MPAHKIECCLSSSLEILTKKDSNQCKLGWGCGKKADPDAMNSAFNM